MFHVEQALFVDVLIAETSIFGIKLNPDQVSALASYYRELDHWNQKINLSAIRDTKEIAIKHFLDSLLYSQALDQRKNASLLDVGSGAGFPGLPLKILAPELHVTLLEPNEKKTSFLRHIIGTLDLKNMSVVSKNLRDFSRVPEGPGRFSYIVTRAVEAEQILPFATVLLEEQGRVIVCLAKSLDADPGKHGFKVSREFAYELPHGFGHRVLTVLQPSTMS
ncbi:MAG: 16S rRNA (guanine(527)-N(7))-methyltransferase RsmG [Nitrospirota bacterium]